MDHTTNPSILTRRELEDRERLVLAGFAMKSADSRGRHYKEPEDPYRTCFRRDHDRIIHSAAFRRLECKTQVFANHHGDYYRTRLTHSIEVAQIGVSIARILRLNEDLVQVVCLAHDIGHAPFGHAGQDVLGRLMRAHGGFEHNRQGLRIVERLEVRYPAFPGLNLTWEVRESIDKHNAARLSGEGHPVQAAASPLMEAQLADLADEIAYLAHDVDDGFEAGILNESTLEASELWRQSVRDQSKWLKACNEEMRRYQIVRQLLNCQIRDLIQETAARIERHSVVSIADARDCGESLVGFSPAMTDMRVQLKRLLWDNLYRHERVLEMTRKVSQMIEELFGAYVNNPALLPNTTRSRIDAGEDKYRVVCDYIAGMTDRYCLASYRKLCDSSFEL